jgi:acyl-coenzyme A thioesterase PaaI-like protein
MTDIGPSPDFDEIVDEYVPARLGTTIDISGPELVVSQWANPATTIHGAMRAAAVVFLVDAAAGISLDRDPEMWTFTSNLSVRMPPILAPEQLLGRAELLRDGSRSATMSVPLTLPGGQQVGLGLATFSRVARRPTDPPKFELNLQELSESWADVAPLSLPLAEAAGVAVVDASAGVVEVPLEGKLLNPAGALQGAMVGLIAEVAAEEMVGAALGKPQIVTDMDIRYLVQARSGPIRTRSIFIGPPADASVFVELIDTALDKVVAVVTLRTHRAPTT